MRYDTDTHMLLSIRLLSTHAGFKGVSVDNSAEDFMAVFTPQAAELQGDTLNYTDIEPII